MQQATQVGEKATWMEVLTRGGGYMHCRRCLGYSERVGDTRNGNGGHVETDEAAQWLAEGDDLDRSRHRNGHTRRRAWQGSHVSASDQHLPPLLPLTPGARRQVLLRGEGQDAFESREADAEPGKSAKAVPHAAARRV